MRRHLRSPHILSLSLLTLAACGDPCLDDGAGAAGAKCDEVASASGSESETSDTATASDSDSESDTNSETDSDSMSGSETDTDTETETETETETDTETDTEGGDNTWCVDVDMDGFGDPENCEDVPEGEDPPAGSVPQDQATDCDDNDANTFPGAAENDSPDECMTDADDDGWGDGAPPNPAAVPGTDCDDANAAAFPGAAENEVDPDACYEDEDDDGWGDTDPEGEATLPGTDCADDDAEVMMCEIWCPDVDMDGFGDDEGCVWVIPGDDPPENSAPNDTDCDDNDPFTFPGAAENDNPDECMTDADEDGWGDDMPDNPDVTPGRDCDDTDNQRVVCVDAIPSCADTTSGNATQLMAMATGGDGNYMFSWDPPETLDDPNVADPMATPVDITTYTVTATDGLGNAGFDEITVHVTDEPWVLGGVPEAECEAIGLIGEAAPHSFSMDGTETCTTANSDPTAFICPTVHEQARITGTMIVTDQDGDDDIVGFVWGWQDTQQFYLFQWKRLTQNWFGCVGQQGMMVKKFDAAGALDFDDFACSSDTPNVTVLATPADTYDQPWVQGIEYGVELAYGQDQTQIIITDETNNLPVADFVIMDDSYPSGQFGTYDFSQINACNGPWQSTCL